jgi:hypothetical protein|tara:strand:- start:2167 stop:2382 length:216 start_codon:yes stop_codon:yes gene_type:complete
MTKYNLYRSPNGISLNGREYALDDDGNVRLFDTKKELLEFIADTEGFSYITEDSLEETFGSYIGIEGEDDE